MKMAEPVFSFVCMKHAAPEARRKRRDLYEERAATRPDWQKIGCETGPLLVVMGRGLGFDGAIRRLKALPSLGYMRGELSISCRTETNDADMYLQLEDLPATETYWRILGAATQLGMISGRGVPQRYLSKAVG